MSNWSAAYEDHCDRLRDERKNEPDLSPRTLDRETARAQLIVDLLSAITAKLSAHIKDDAAVSEIVDMVLAYRRAS